MASIQNCALALQGTLQGVHIYVSWFYDIHIHSYSMGGDLLTSAECLNIIRGKEMKKHAAKEVIQSC